MFTTRHARRLFTTLFAALSLVAPAPAAFETLSGGGALRLMPADTPDIIGQGNFSILFYYRPSALPATEAAAILEIPGSLRIRLSTGGLVSATLFHEPPEPVAQSQGSAEGHDGSIIHDPTLGVVNPPIVLTAPLPLQPDEFALIAISFEGNGNANLWVSQGDEPISHTTKTVDGFDVGTPTDAINFGAVRIVGTPIVPAAEGLYDIFVVRRHRLNTTDIQFLRDRRRDYDLYDLENRTSGGNFNGGAGALLMINHSILAEPFPMGGFLQNLDSSIVGYPALSSSVSRLDVTTVNYGLTFAGPAMIATNIRHRSHYEPEFSGYFVRTPFDGPALPAPTPAVAPRSKQLANGAPQGLIKVMISANSRAARRSEQIIEPGDPQVGPPSIGSYLGGFWNEYADLIAGALFVPVLPNINADYRAFNTIDNQPRSTGQIFPIRGSTTQAHEFSRLWTGSVATNAYGPGTGSYLTNGSTYELKARPESRMPATEPLVVQIHTLKFPGASTVRYSSVKEDQQSGGDRFQSLTNGVNAFTVDLDTTHTVITFTAQDSITAPARVLTVQGDYTNQIAVGDAVSVRIDSAANFSTVRSIESDGLTTDITFSTSVAGQITPGVQFRFGPWEHLTLEYEWPALTQDDHRTWRGLHCEVMDNGSGAVLFAYSCFNPNADGFAFGAAGWSGNGYQAQIDNVHDDVIASFAAQSQADIWFQVPAQQNAEPVTMTLYANELELGLPEHAEIIWAGEMTHGTNNGLFDRPFDEWHQFILDVAPLRGFPVISALHDPEIGDFKSQLIDGLRIDQAHISQRGNELLVSRWMDQLRGIARDPGDCNGDNTVTFDDLICTLFEFGAINGPADCDRSGVVDFNDLICTLFSFPANP